MNTLRTLKETRCYSCNTLFAMQDDLYETRLKDGRSFYCPIGHSQIFTGRRDELQKLKEDNQRLNSRAAWAEQEAKAAKRERTAIKGQLTKTRNRIANGVCPCCHRTFKQLAAHMGNKHPDFKAVVA